ncbi:FtsX-like permease family protein [Lactovum odontotermitis]
MLTLKLALSNLRKGFRSFAPFLMSTITMFALIFVTASISLSKSLTKMPGSIAIISMMTFALFVLMIFGTIILIYSYRFLQNQRSKEFGLYDILGFGKRKIAGVAFFELLFSFILTVVLGTVVGIALAKFLFLIYINLIQASSFNLAINPLSIALVAAIFLVIFLVLFLIGCVIIGKSSSLDLLRQDTKGEKEPKSNIVVAVLGVLLIGAGYFIAIRVTDPIAALTQFFIAVLLVIFGTYLFYISSTVWYLKWRKKRNSYYQPRNFIKISSLLYRMKANAVGLGNITILLSMAVVTIATTVVLYFGTGNVIAKQYPTEGQAYSIRVGMTRSELVDGLEQAAGKANITLPKDSIYPVRTGNNVMLEASGSSLNLTDAAKKFLVYKKTKNAVNATISTVQDLNTLKNKLPSLADNQIYLYDLTNSTKKIDQLNIGGTSYQVKSHLETLKNFPMNQSIGADEVLIIFPSDVQLDSAVAAYNQGNSGEGNEIIVMTNANFEINKSDEAAFMKALPRGEYQPRTFGDITVSFKSDEISNQRMQFGGFIFIGFILGIAFILGAALIIYYKQLSEATQDKRSFKILQEVGLSKIEVRKTIKSQVRMIFFLPIVVTIVHFGFAFNMISKIEEAFGIREAALMLGLSAVTIIMVALIYWLIYKLTSRVYYNIVERAET